MIVDTITTVYSAIFDFINEQGYAPTNAELLALIHIEHARVFEAIHWLESKGLVYREGRQWRNLRLTGKACDSCGDPLQPDTIVLEKYQNRISLRKCCKTCYNASWRQWYSENIEVNRRKNNRDYQKRSELRN